MTTPAARAPAGTHAGLPGMRGLEHVGFTVPDLPEAVGFFCNILGCVEIYRFGGLSRDDNWMADNLDVHPRAALQGMSFLRCADGSNLELIEFQAPDQIQRRPRNSDFGGHHLAFYVDDCQTAADYLRSKGVRVLGEPKHSPSGPSAGQSWVYFLTPWGMQCELVSFPSGKACERGAGPRPWRNDGSAPPRA